MKITPEEMENLVYRKQRLLEKTRKLEYLLSGRNTSFLQKIRTKAGKHSEARTWKFIEQLIGALETYENCGEDDVMQEERKNFYRSYLYCAIRAAEENPWWIWMTRGTFDDILMLAERTHYYGSKYELYFYELYREPEVDGFFSCMDELYLLFTGKEITGTVSEEDMAEMKKRYAYEIEDMETGDEAYWKEYYDAFPGMSMEEIEQQGAQEEWESADDEMQKAELEKEKEKHEWVKNFSHKNIFCEQYELCRSLYFKEVTTPKALTLKIERMMDVYLYEQGDSHFMDNDVYFYTFALLNKTVQMTAELERSKHGI